MASNLVGAAQAGLQTGREQAKTNPLGIFIKGMLAQQQKKQLLQQTFKQQAGLTIFKEGIKNLFGDKVSEKQKFLKQLWNQAGQDAFKESGGSFFVGLNEKKKAAFVNLRKQRFKQLTTAFDIGGDIAIPGEEETSKLTPNPEPEEDVDNIDIFDVNFSDFR